MFQQMLNELQIQLEIRPDGPLLIKEGRHRADGQKDRLCFHPDVRRTPEQPRKRDGRGYGQYTNPDECFDMAFVYTQTQQGPRFYIPGSSLRGVLRHTAEQLIGRWRPEWARASDPFANLSQQWVQQQRDQNQPPDGAAIYQSAGPIERCFGHTMLRGRWVCADAWMHDERQSGVVVRDGVGINRTTGAAQHDVKFQFEAITGGVFHTTLTLVNYELWQPGLLAHVLAAIDGGTVRLGYGTRRGLGRIRVRVRRLIWRWYMPSSQQPQMSEQTGRVMIPSLQRLAADRDIPNNTSYGWCDGDLSLDLPLVREEGTLVPNWILTLPDGNATDWDATPWPDMGSLLPTALRQWSMPQEVTL